MTAEPSELNDQILEFVSRTLGIKRSKIKIDSELNNDLGMNGVDAIEFSTLSHNAFRLILMN